MQFGKREPGISRHGYVVADQLRLFTKDRNLEILGNVRVMFEAVKDSLVEFSFIKIQKNMEAENSSIKMAIM
jgi:hypothetical protein